MRQWRELILPPQKALTTALIVLAAIMPVAVIAGVVHGDAGVIAVLLGVVATAPVALAMPSRRWGAGFVVLASLAAASGSAGHGYAFVVAATVALAALAQVPVSMRIGAVGAMLPGLAAVFGSIDATWVVIGVWTAAGGAATLVIVTALGIHRSPTAVPRRTAWRHGTLMAVAASTITTISVHWSVPHGYWAVVTLCVVLQPVHEDTTRKALDRALGTAVGAIAAGVLAVLLPSPAALAVAGIGAVLMVGWALAAQERRQTIFLTPVVVLVGSSGLATALELALERVALSTLGAALAVLLATALHWYEARRATAP